MIARPALLLAILGVIGTTFALNGQLTHYCSYPPCCKTKNISPPYTKAEKDSCPGTSECDDYSGCKYQGDFAFCGHLSHADVIKTPIVALFSKHGDIKKYQGKMIRVKQGSKTIEAKVCDTCADKDCDGCCSKNAGSSGYLIDMESNAYAAFKGSDGPVTWECINC